MTWRCLMFVAACVAASPAFAQDVRSDLGRVLVREGEAQTGSGGLDGIATERRIRTQPYSTSFAGVCRRDEVLLGYAAGGEPVAVRAEARFRVLPGPFPDTFHRTGPLDGPCRALDPGETSGWFVSSDVFTAIGGHQALLAAIEQVGKPHNRVIGCRDGLDQRNACRTAIGGAQGEVTAIARCATPARLAHCYAVTMGNDTIVSIQVRYDGKGGTTVIRIDIEWPPIMV